MSKNFRPIERKSIRWAKFALIEIHSASSIRIGVNYRKARRRIQWARATNLLRYFSQNVDISSRQNSTNFKSILRVISRHNWRRILEHCKNPRGNNNNHDYYCNSNSCLDYPHFFHKFSPKENLNSEWYCSWGDNYATISEFRRCPFVWSAVVNWIDLGDDLHIHNVYESKQQNETGKS